MTGAQGEAERPPPPPDALAELIRLGTCRLVDVMGVGLLSSEIRPLLEPTPAIAGPAVTVKVRPGDFGMIPWAVDRLEHGDVLVIDGAGHQERAIWGDFVSTRARQVGCAGVVIDGACRDIAGIRRLAFPVFSRGRTARGPTRDGGGAIEVPVVCGGISVLPGDLVVADEDGIVAVAGGELGAALRLGRAKLAAEPRPAGADESSESAWLDYLGRQGPAPEGTPPRRAAP